ncbi:MAG: hypothetical protein ACLU99_01750 [Alphaproteobacteria bacterium]
MIVIAVSAIVGIWLISSLINHLFLTPTVRPVVVPVKPKAVQQVQQPPEVKPWEKLDDPEMVLNSCYDKNYRLGQNYASGLGYRWCHLQFRRCINLLAAGFGTFGHCPQSYGKNPACLSAALVFPVTAIR